MSITHEVLEQGSTDAAPLGGGSDVGVADQLDVTDLLDPHDPAQLTVGLLAVEDNTGRQFGVELGGDMYGSRQRSAGMTPR